MMRSSNLVLHIYSKLIFRYRQKNVQNNTTFTSKIQVAGNVFSSLTSSYQNEGMFNEETHEILNTA